MLLINRIGITSKQVEPLALEFYLSYGDWFRQQKRLNVVSAYVERLSRLDKDSVKIWPKSRVASCLKLSTGEVEAAIDAEGKEDRIVVDHIILATGYRVNMAQLPLLAQGNLLERLETRNGSPVLDERFQSSVPGLFITSMPAAQDFGPFLAFTVSVRASAKVIASALKASLH